MSSHRYHAWIPALTAFLAVAVQELALPWQAWSVLRPDLLMISLFYWRLYRPDLCGAGFAFFAGFAVDAASGAPLGINALSKTFIVLLMGGVGARLRSADFVLLLPLLFTLVVLDELCHFSVFLLLQGPEVRWALFWGRPLATILLAPLVVNLLIHLHQRWLEER